MKNIFFFAALAAFAASCSDNDSDRCTPPDQIAVNSVIASPKSIAQSDSRTTITGSTAAWANNDVIGVYCGESKPAASNLQFTVTGLPSSPVWTPSSPIYWLDGNTSHKFLGYAPYAAGNSDPAAVKIPSLGTQTGTIAPAQDFLISNGLYTSGITRTATVPLVFTHAFALIELKMSVTGFTAGSTLTNFTLAGGSSDKLYTTDAASTINLSTGAVTTGAAVSNTTTITPSTPPVLTTTAASYYAIILPGTFTAPTLAISILEGSTTITPTTVSLGTTLFEAGKKYSYTINISRTAITLSNITITEWITTNGGTLTPGV